MKRRRAILLMAAFICSLLMFAGTASAATLTNLSDSQTVIKGKAVTAYVKPGVQTNYNDYCYLNVYDSTGNRVFHEEKSYSSMDSKVKFSFVLNSSGKYRVNTGTYYYYNQTNSSTSGKTQEISINAATASEIKANKPAVTGKSNGSGKVVLSIDGLGNKYDIYRATSSGGTYKKIGTTSSTSYTDKTAGQKIYYYKAKGKVTSGSNTYSTKNSSAVKVNAKITGVSVNFKLSLDNSDNVVLKVTSSPKSTGYMIYRATSKSGTYKLVKTTTSGSFTDKSVSDKTYYYKVKPYATVNGKKLTGNYSSVKSIEVNNPNKPGKPTVEIADFVYENGVVAKNYVSVSFDKVANATEYRLYVSKDGGKTYSLGYGGWFQLKDKDIAGNRKEGWAVNFSPSGSGQTYYFKLAVINENYQNGNYENFSDPVKYKIP